MIPTFRSLTAPRLAGPLLASWLGLATVMAPAAASIPIDPDLPSYRPQSFEQRSGARYVLPDGAIRVIGAEHVQTLLERVNAVFAEKHPGSRFSLQLKGTTTAMPALTHDVSVFAPMGREVSSVELVPYAKIVGQEPIEIRVAHAAHSTRPLATSLGVYVNQANPVDRLTVEQLARIFGVGHPKGDLTRWGQLGAGSEWASRAIHVIATPAYTGFGEYLERHHLDNRPLARAHEEAGNTEAILKRVSEDPSAIGVAAIGRANAKLKMVALAPAEGAAYSTGSEDDARSGKYPLARYLYFYVRRTPGQPVDPLVREYFRLLLSKEGQQIIAAEADGYIPLTAREAEAELAKLQTKE